MEQVWNYSFTVPCALLMVTLTAFYFSRPRLPIHLNRTFLGLLMIQLLVMAFDVGSSLADQHYTQFSPATLYVLNTAFFVLFLIRIFWFYLFTLDITKMRSRRILMVSALPLAVCVLIALSSFATGAVFRIEDGAYRSGPLYNILYVCFFLYIIMSICILAIKGKRLRKTELIAAFAYNIVLVAGNVVRFMFPYLLAMNTFCMVAIVIIYLEFLNPDLYLTSQGPAFNMRGFRLVLSNLTGHKNYQVLCFMLKNYNYERSILGAGQMDEVINQVVQHLAKAFPGMLLFYLRGGRFALVRTGSTDWGEVREQIHERFSQSWQTEHIDLSLNIGFAFASIDTNAQDSESIATNILIGLDESRDLPEYGATLDTSVTPNTQTIDQHVDVLRSLEHALERNEVELFLQPLIDCSTREIIAAEALARIRDAKGNIIQPGIFIPLAERSGYINMLGNQMLEKVCEFVESQDMNALGLRWINVNLSPIQCMQQNMAEQAIATLESHHVPTRHIHLEVTEQSMIDYSLLKKQMHELQKKGFELSLDDYGTGYSNLTRIKHYPFTNIKIDMEVIWDYTRQQDELLPAIVQGFHQMGFTVTAEGIENRAMAELISSIGIDYLQGFYFCKPLPLNEFVERYGQPANH